MEKDFWLEKWQQGDIGFHQSEVNHYLQTYWQRLEVEAGALVFVPMSGKTLDMLWLRNQGYQVIAVEISERACRAFFDENQLSYTETSTPHFLKFKADGITLFCGDFFQLTPDDVKGVEAVFDRAAMVALPASLRGEYIRHLGEILSAQAALLLVTMTYQQAQMDGPPFSVSHNEVLASYAEDYRVSVLLRQDILASNPRFRDKGLSELVEIVYLIQPQ